MRHRVFRHSEEAVPRLFMLSPARAKDQASSWMPCSLQLCAWGENPIIKEYGDKQAVWEDKILNNLDPRLTKGGQPSEP